VLCALPVHFVRADAILPNECHYPEHAASLTETIRSEELWRIPIVLECNSMASHGWSSSVASCIATQAGLCAMPVASATWR
jgi:hypothetical protein